MVGGMDGLLDESTDEWTNGLTDGPMGGRTKGLMG